MLKKIACLILELFDKYTVRLSKVKIRSSCSKITIAVNEDFVSFLNAGLFLCLCLRVCTNFWYANQTLHYPTTYSQFEHCFQENLINSQFLHYFQLKINCNLKQCRAFFSGPPNVVPNANRMPNQTSNGRPTEFHMDFYFSWALLRKKFVPITFLLAWHFFWVAF
jgi:hypothetical protein